MSNTTPVAPPLKLICDRDLRLDGKISRTVREVDAVDGFRSKVEHESVLLLSVRHPDHRVLDVRRACPVVDNDLRSPARETDL